MNKDNLKVIEIEYLEEDNPSEIERNVQEIENYMDLINHIKARITIDKNGLTKEVRSIVKECKDEIVFLRESIEKLQTENSKIFRDNQIMAKQIYLNHKLLDVKDNAKKEKLKKLLLSSDADMKFMDVEKIDNMFEIILGEKE